MGSAEDFRYDVGCSERIHMSVVRLKPKLYEALMEIGRIEGATRVLGQSQGYIGLPLRDTRVNSTVDGPDTPAMETAWFPTPLNLKRSGPARRSFSRC